MNVVPAGGSPEHVDVLVAGSGAAGLVAALTCAIGGLRVLVCERAEALGGTTALSGGRVWVPGNRFQPDPEADRRAAGTYLAGIFDPGYGHLTEAFLDAVPEMARFVEAHTAHRFAPCPHYPDYHPDRAGATLGGRCLDMAPLHLDALVPLAARVRVPPGYVPVTHAEWERWRYPHRYDRDLIERRRADRVVTAGVALTAALVDGVVRAGGEVVTGHRVVDVDPDPRGRLRVRLERVAGDPVTVLASHVVLATGGYDQNGALRRAYLPAALGASGSSPSNTGDALDVCRRLGARVDNLGQGWWMPMVSVPGEEVDGVPAFRGLVRERGAPRQILVDRSGRRFVDEALPYNEIGKAMHRRDADGRCPHAEAYLVVDEGYRRRYALPGLATDRPVPDWIVSAPTVRELAGRLGVDPDGLSDQVARWNEACARGSDDEFGKGDNAYDRYYGDPDQPGNPNLGPIDTPPYYGVRMLPGTIGSKGGPVTDVDGRVLDRADRPIPGIFAVGNAAAFWTADGYPGPGATLGVGMAFGFRAGRAIAAAAGAGAG
ncbi:FAD-dependent oxidoreductase [Planosporangium sp. 12N6]|uniref:FAD-dependent oxidoreductase n=1 Tax=Planosporangium spinosum TaxID=3402278 RepID=UPI003CE976B0